MGKIKVFVITLYLSLVQAVCFAEEAINPSKTKTFDELQKVFMRFGVDGAFNLQSQALYLIGIFAIISLCTTWALYTGEWQLQQMISVIIKTSFFIMLALSWSDILNMIFSGFRTAGLVAAGEAEGAKMWTASGIISMGDRITKALSDSVFGSHSFGPDRGIVAIIESIPTMFFSMFAWLVIKACFYWIAFSLVLTNIEFAMFTCITMLMMPFGMLRWTETYFNKAVNGVFHFGIKMMVLYFILAMLKANTQVFTWMGDNAQAIGTSLSCGEVLNQVALFLLTALLVWMLPELAAGLLDGTPNISAGSAVAGTGRAVGLTRTGFGYGSAGIRSGFRAGKAIANSKRVQKAAAWVSKWLPH